jgi:hypothetical protein
LAKLLRLFVALFAVLSLSAALAACGDDDDEATDTTSEDTRDAEEGGDDEGTDDGGEEEGNPCAEGAEVPTDPEAEAPSGDATPVTVTATDYAFAGGDEMATQGSYAVTLANEGQELHELALVRLAEGEERSIEELISLPEEPELTEVGGSFACPGTSAEPVAVEIDTPGRYVMICFIPVGTLPTTTEPVEGPPHASQGMVKEFTVA